MAGIEFQDTAWVYLLKASGTNEFCRYNPITDQWQNRAPAPMGASGKPFASGSCLTSDGTSALYALKGGSNELYRYNIAQDSWSSLPSLPVENRGGGRKRAKRSAGLAWFDRSVYCLKASHSLELWSYSEQARNWVQLTDVPRGLYGRDVGGGAALTAGEDGLYLLKGNNTSEFYCLKLPLAQAARPGSGVAGSGSFGTRPGLYLRVGPTPCRSRATVSYSLPQTARLRLSLYTLTGALVQRLADGKTQAGNRMLTVNTEPLARGLYLLRMETPFGRAVQKLVRE
jgi:hypothetical protein